MNTVKKRLANLQSSGLTTSDVSTLITDVLINVPGWSKYQLTYVDFATDALTNTIDLFTLTKSKYIHDIKIVPTTAFRGGIIATYTLSVGIAGSLLKYQAATDVFTGNTTINGVHTIISGLESYSAITDIKITAVSTVGLLDTATDGAVDVWVLTSVLI